MKGRATGNNLTGPLSVSALLHLSVAVLAVWTFRPSPPVALPPIYKVNIVAAPPGPRAIGEVKSGPAPVTPPETPAPRTREVAPAPLKAPTPKASPAPAATKATPTTSTAKPKANTPAPKAGGGPKGGTGSDVATVKTDGIDFPYPGYLNNIVRQIALNFKPRNPNAPLRAEIAFLIHRDGSVSNIRFITRSGVYSFDLEAQGAIEKAKKYFGPLPEGFRDDVLPVVFSFDPKFLQ
jgi:protein TonB